MSTRHRIIIGDSRLMPELEDRSVHLVVTSPPYWQLKDYGVEGQLGFGDSYGDYISDLNLVWSECARVLHPGCRLCVNIGDQFARAAWYGRYKVIPIRTEIIRFCEAVGLDYMGAVIWRKVTSTRTTGGGSVMGSYPYPRNGILKIDYEFILLFRKHGRPPRVKDASREASRLSAEEWNEYFSGHWSFPGARQRQHLAAFPEELPRRLIRMFSFTGETVLDPFLGSGTTSVAAARLERDSVGYEINSEFVSLIRDRLAGRGASAELIRRDSHAPGSLEEARRGLSLVQPSPEAPGLRTDPRENNYGSRVRSDSPEREKYFRVKRVLSPVEVELNDGRAILLAGIQEIVDKREDAASRLAELTSGCRVYLRPAPGEDGERKDPHVFLLYLENRTFVNRRMVREGLAAVKKDTEPSLARRLRAK